MSGFVVARYQQGRIVVETFDGKGSADRIAELLNKVVGQKIYYAEESNRVGAREREV